MNEFDFIRHYLSSNQTDNELLCGVGDDAAIVRFSPDFDYHISTDMLIADRHFFRDIAPDDLAYKILAVNISDMAAMGAKPKYILLSAGVPYLDKKWLDLFFASLQKVLNDYQIKLIGGDTVKGDFVFNVTIMGKTPKNLALKRNGAKTGDDIWVSGKLGLAAVGLLLEQEKRNLSGCLKDNINNIFRLPENILTQCRNKLLRPEPRVNLGQELLTVANSALDCSDGLLQDLGHILENSQKNAVIYLDKIPSIPELKLFSDYPQWILSGGEDYELIFTASPHKKQQIEEISQKCCIDLTKIGTIIEQEESVLCRVLNTENGQEIKLNKAGFDHFS
ncbi:MAG: thiamine-phosphate kinase [Neisseriaceae bacterium]|nr:thiamine-phosphate kinase [Neisseriaceae bacterium]